MTWISACSSQKAIIYFIFYDVFGAWQLWSRSVWTVIVCKTAVNIIFSSVSWTAYGVRTTWKWVNNIIVYFWVNYSIKIWKNKSCKLFTQCMTRDNISLHCFLRLEYKGFLLKCFFRWVMLCFNKNNCQIYTNMYCKPHQSVWQPWVTREFVAHVINKMQISSQKQKSQGI